MVTTYVEGEIVEEILVADLSQMNVTVIVDTWNGTTTTAATTISPARQKLYDSLTVSAGAIVFILFAILILYQVKTSQWYRQWWTSREYEKTAKKEEKARLKAKAEREKEEEEDEEEYSV